MSLWVDRHRPNSLADLHYHSSLSDQLSRLAASPDFPHLLVYGPPGAGKKTRVNAVLREIYGPGVEKLRLDLRVFTTPSGRKLEINVMASNYHIELTPSDVGNYDRVVVQDLIKEMAQTQQVDANAKRHFKVAVLNEADSLSRDAQAALRRTMEKYMSNLRIIICCNSSSKIIAPIRSRCLLVRVAAPSIPEIKSVLQHVATKEKIDLPDSFATRLAESCNGNLRRAVLMLEAAKTDRYPFSDSQRIAQPDWEMFIAEMAQSIVQEQSPQRLLQVRTKLYDLLGHCIPADVIIKQLAFELLKTVDDSMRVEVIKFAADFDHRLRKGNKAIFHLEAFVARFMATYRSYLNEISMSLDDF
ncbi:P-loop containing nucleoside triphosphate hydrolase protein [Cladochytrium replicatum]|nr:P-loop containing nucleoside triphosphate hydrolase protein [Cladochytrium replicatum]